MTKKELHDKFQQMLGQQVEDVMASFGKALERIDDIENTIDTKLDAKFDEVLARVDRGEVSRSFDEMITIDLVETTLTIRLQMCTM